MERRETSGEQRAHWEAVWGDRAPDEVSWHQARPAVSLSLIDELDLDPEARILDVGGGASTLVDHLLERGQRNITVLDIAEPALAHARERLGERARRVRWLVGDVLTVDLGGAVDLWHDRAVLHFLTDPHDQRTYADRLAAHLRPGGHAILATFSPRGPTTCSARSVQRYDAPALATLVGDRFDLVTQQREDHRTPWDDEQSFQYAVFRRTTQ